MFNWSAASLRRAKSRASAAAFACSRKYLRNTRSMTAERECFVPARRSILTKTSVERVTDVFSFIMHYATCYPNFCRVSGWSKPIGISIIAISGLRSRISGKLWRYSTEVIPLQSHATIQPLLQPSIPARIIHEFYYARSASLRAGLWHKEEYLERILRHDSAALDSLALVSC